MSVKKQVILTSVVAAGCGLLTVIVTGLAKPGLASLVAGVVTALITGAVITVARLLDKKEN